MTIFIDYLLDRVTSDGKECSSSVAVIMNRDPLPEFQCEFRIAAIASLYPFIKWTVYHRSRIRIPKSKIDPHFNNGGGSILNPKRMRSAGTGHHRMQRMVICQYRDFFENWNPGAKVLRPRDSSRSVMVETGRTDADEFELMPDDLIVGVIFQIMGYKNIGFRRSIGHPVTFETADVVMSGCHPVKTFQAAAKREFLNFTAFGKDFKVAVDSPQADAGKTFANHFVYLISAGMRIYFSKFFQDDLTLPRHPEV
jgi:hypothetical protein